MSWWSTVLSTSIRYRNDRTINNEEKLCIVIPVWFCYLKMKEILENMRNNWMQAEIGDENIIFLRYTKNGRSSIHRYFGDIEVWLIDNLCLLIDLLYSRYFRFANCKHYGVYTPAFHLKIIIFNHCRFCNFCTWCILCNGYSSCLWYVRYSRVSSVWIWSWVKHLKKLKTNESAILVY